MGQVIIETERLLLRNWSKSDEEPFSKMNSDPEVMKFFPSILTKDESDGLIQRIKIKQEEFGFCYFAAVEKETNDFLGFIGYMYQDYPFKYTPFIDIGWRLKKEAWGKGYATEGAAASIEHARNQGLSEIYSVAVHKNHASFNVMKKIGMKEIDTIDHPKISKESGLNPCKIYHLHLQKES